MKILEWKKNKKKHHVLLNVGVKDKNNFAKLLYSQKKCKEKITNKTLLDLKTYIHYAFPCESCMHEMSQVFSSDSYSSNYE
jgi:hypothetical protein